MSTIIKFGECLKFLLSVLDISFSRLSKAINVDCSLINRWIHGKRIPPYNTPYIEDICEYLSKNVLNTFQVQRLDEFFLNVYKYIPPEASVKDKMKKVLLESQGYSIECKKQEGKDNSNDNNFMWNTQYLTHSVDLSSEDKIIYGVENVFKASIFLLEAAANQVCKNNNTIYISYSNDGNMRGNNLIHLRNALLKAINNGWNVQLLLGLNNNSKRTMRFIKFAIPLICTGKFMTYYIKKYDSFTTVENIIIVPEVGSLSCFSRDLYSGISCGFYLKSQAAIDIFMDHFKVILTTSAQPLMKNYPNQNVLDYFCCLIESEENIGNRFLYKYCFSVLMLPENLFEKLLKKKKILNAALAKTLEFQKRRLNAFLLNIQSYEYKDIYYADSIKDLIQHRQFCFYNYSGVEIINLEIQDIIELLQNIIHLLETYDNYSIAFIPQNADSAVIGDNFFCVFKERQAVLLEVFKPSKSLPDVRLSIKEPMLINALDEYFKEIWEHIAPINKEKKEVIAWIQKQINILKNS